MRDKFKEAALEYHRYPVPGKLEVTATKKMVNQRDLSLAYSPGVAAACEAIVDDPREAAFLTARGNLVAVISNGTAVLGLGSIGPLAAKPVMEGKAVLFKKFAGIDVFDLEINETNPGKFVDIVAALEPTFGGINLEDIKAPDCFEIEKQLKARLNIPVFHDDQHGTAICVATAVRNGLRIAKKEISKVKLVCSGAGSAALACLDLLVKMGMQKENITVCDRSGVIYKGREVNMDIYKAGYARETSERTLNDAIGGADIFLGLSGAGLFKAEQAARMAETPLILALANPNPEILPEDVQRVRSDAIIATGRSDYPNQVNNVLCFPFLFRGALDVGATEINDAMKFACVEALADLTLAETSDVVSAAYGGAKFSFGPEYIIPKPFDPRLMITVPVRVAKAAMESGVATRPIADFDVYVTRLQAHVFRSGMVMRPMFEVARENPRRIIYVEGESTRVLSAAQVLVDDRICRPVLVGRPAVMLERIKEMGLRIRPHEHFEVLELEKNEQYERDWRLYYEMNQRNGIKPVDARALIAKNPTVLAALRVKQGEADAMICGVHGKFAMHLKHLRNIINLRVSANDCSTVNIVLLKRGIFFIADTHIQYNPSAQHIAETTVYAADIVRRFGLEPKVALLSHANFGESQNASARKMREAMRLLEAMQLDFEFEGEMQADVALSELVRERVFPNSRLKDTANLLMMPNMDAANIVFTLLKSMDDAVSVGPIMVGFNKAAHILDSTVTVRGIVNMSAIAAVHSLRIEYLEQERMQRNV